MKEPSRYELSIYFILIDQELVKGYFTSFLLKFSTTYLECAGD